MERFYETIFIVRPDLGDESIKGLIQKSADGLKGGGAEVLKVDEWGRRRLAYPIQKKNEGYYVLIEYRSTPSASSEFERNLKHNEDVVRYQTVRLEEPSPAAKAAPSEEAASGEATGEGKEDKAEAETEGGDDE